MIGNMKKTLASVVLFGFFSLNALASVTTISGKPTAIADYVGKGEWTIIEAWHSKCKICIKTMPDMVKANGTFPDANLVGISLDGNRAKAEQVVKRFKVNFPTLLTDIDEFAVYVRKVSGKELLGVPTYLVFSPEGKLKAMQAGNISTTELRKYLKRIKKKLAKPKQSLEEQIIDYQGELEFVSPE